MKLFKTIINGIWYTLLAWIAFLLILCTCLVLVPFALLALPVGAFMYASDPELIVKEQEDAEDA